MNSKYIAIIAAVVAGSETALNAQVLFSDTLQGSDGSGWTINHSGSDYSATFGYDYSALGISQDPYLSGSSTALKLQVNQTAGSIQGVTLSPTGFGVTGDFSMTFDMFCNYNISGAGSTQIANYGIGTSGTTPIWSVNNDGLEFGNILDNGSATSYRGYLANVGLTSANFAAGSQNYANSYYTSLFPSVAIPAGEGQTGSSAAGTVSYQWVQVAITQSGSTVNELINGNLIATVDSSSLTDSNIFLGLYDSNNGSANTDPDYNFVLFNNIVVTAAPEPTTCALAALGGVGFLLARRRNANARK